MRRASILSLGVGCLRILLSVAFPLHAAALTLYVGTPGDYATIQGAVTAADSGDTIIVRDGTYTETVDVDISLTIQSENGNSVTFVDADGSSDDAFDVSADYVTIEGFSIFHTGGAGIYLDSVSHCHVSDNRCGYDDSHRCTYGIAASGMTYSTISDNVCAFNIVTGITMNNNSDHNTLSNNECSENIQIGIHLINVQYNTLSGNNSNGNVSSGIALSSGADHNLILSNTAELNDRHGIQVNGGNSNMIKWNTFYDNQDSGIKVDPGSEGNVFVGNTIESNDIFGIDLDSDNNVFYFNNLVDQAPPVVTDDSNTWQSPKQVWYNYGGLITPSHQRSYMGNYYSGHGLSDSNGDGICDTAVDLPGPYDDEYPLYESNDNYSKDMPCTMPAAINPGEELMVLESLIIYDFFTSGKLTLEGQLTIGAY